MKFNKMDQPLNVRGHHLGDIHILALLGSNHPRYESLIRSYTPNIRETKLKNLKDLENDPDKLIRITDDLDYICQAQCPNLRESCTDVNASSIDKFVAEVKYGFLIDQTYSAAEVIEKLKKHQYRSPYITITTAGQILPGPLSPKPTLYYRAKNLISATLQKIGMLSV